MQVACQAVGNLCSAATHGVPLLCFPSLERAGVVRHAFTTRIGGVSRPPFHWLNLSLSVGDDGGAVRENRSLVAHAAAMPLERTASCRQESGGRAVIVDADSVARQPTADALVTRTPGIYLRIGLADCLPIVLADSTVPVVAIAHAGWRGTVARIAENTWLAMQSLGAKPASTTAYMGPAIGPCCYEIGADVIERVQALGEVADGALCRKNGSHHLDLAALNASLLAAHGVHSEFSGCCTACHTDVFFSHRAEGGKTGRFAAYVGIEP